MYRILMILVSVLMMAGVVGYTLFNRETPLPVTPLPEVPSDITINTPVISKENQEYSDMMQEIEEEKTEERAQKINDIELANIAITARDSNQCQAIQSEAIKRLCEYRIQEALAIEENSIASCDAISDEEKKKLCNDKVYYTQALEKSDTILCDMIEDSGVRGECFSRVEEKIYKGVVNQKSASGTPDSINCGEFSNGGMRSRCLADQNTKGDYSLLSQALKSQSSGVCDSILDEKIQSECYDGVRFLDAKNSLSLQDCEKILNATVKSQCIMTISAMSDSKNFQEALQKQDISLCEPIVSMSLRGNCNDRVRFNYIIQSKNISDCSLLSDSSLREVCINSLGSN